MGIGAMFKTIILAVICISLLGFATSPAVHQAAWDNIGELVPIDDLIDQIPDVGDDEPDTSFFLFPEDATLTLNQTITITANGGDVTDFFILIVAPDNGGNVSRGDPMTQTYNGIDAFFDPSGYVNVTNLTNPVGSWASDWANLSMNQSMGDLLDTESVTVSIIYNITSHFVWWPDADVDSGNLDDIPQWANDTYMGDMLWNRSAAGQVGYQPDLPQIQTLSDSIVGAETNVYSILRSIFLWNYENISYEVGHSDLRSVEETLENMSGDCDDQSALFVSLARAAGVPAWMQMGMLYNADTNVWENHVWVQTYIPGVGNVSIDPSNDLFLLNRPDRITTYTDQGIAEDMEMFYYYIGVAGPASVFSSLTPEYYSASSTEIQVPFSHMR